ncbi:hypothetical protein ACFUEN_29265 [Streptomyces griseorubiginosus]|uniref:hypothetical protein n=1 Tax=Streptomyces griseorubiginosus TaxID=67304 RepID=UPI0036306417
MNIAVDLYLGWETLDHALDCPLPVWEPQLKIDEGRRGRLGVGDDPHGCAADECGHANLFRRFTVRLVCRSCESVHVISGEDVGIYSQPAEQYGYGHAPLEVEGLWLWAGQRLQTRSQLREPREYLVTRTPQIPAQASDVAGMIAHHNTAGQHPRWQASAIADPNGQHGDRDGLRWARRQADLRSVELAAAWIATQYQPEILEVAV